MTCFVCCRQLGVLVKKNYISKTRTPIEWGCEVLIPLLFVAIIALVFALFDKIDSPNTSYALDTKPILGIPGGLGLYSVQPLSILPYRVNYLGQKVAVVADSAAQIPLRDDFIATMDAWHPAFDFYSMGNSTATNNTINAAFATPLQGTKIPTIPKFSDAIIKFDSMDALNTYVRSSGYDSNWRADSTANPKVWGAISFIKGALPGESYEYALRLNNTVTPSTDAPPVAVIQRGAVLNNIISYLQATVQTNGPPFLRDQGDAVSLKPMPGFMTLQREVDRYFIYKNGGANFTAFDPMSRLAVFFQMMLAASPLTTGAAIGAVVELQKAVKSLIVLNPLAYKDLLASVNGFLASDRYPPQDVDVVPFPVKAYTSNTFYSLVLTILSFILVIAYVVPNSRLIRAMVTEKESRMREGMKMMGLGTFALFGSHMVWYCLCYHLPLSLLIAAIAKGSFFPATNFAATFFLFWLFGISSTAFMFLLSTFFSNAKLASNFCILAFIAAYFPLFSFNGTSTLESKRSMAILCPTAFGLGLNLIGSFENNASPTLYDVIIADPGFGNWSFSASIGMMILDTILYCLLGLYVDTVLPGSVRGYGVARPFYFCCTPSYWMEVFGCGGTSSSSSSSSSHHHSSRANSGGCCRRPSLASTASDPSTSPSAFGGPSYDSSFIEEPDTAMLALKAGKRTVALTGLRKEFSTPDGIKVAVDRVDLEMYEGQIFVLLGPNGAGKTTTISMLTGLIEPTSGTATFYGQDVYDNVGTARNSLGVCPQHDVLWPELTVAEHLYTFAAIKGVPPGEVAREVSKIIMEVGLTEKVNVTSSSLSGGMKRKLSVAIALIGGSKVVILDEPTSGMDPYSRRSTWNIIQSARAGRIVLLTTHFMDEADILGERIAIMSQGKVRCCGSPQFLKKRFGVGYLLVLVKDKSAPTVPTTDVLALLRTHVPEATLASSVAAEVSIRLPLSSSPSFPAMLTDLDASLARLSIVSYGISVTSIEDVFLKIASEANAPGAGGASAAAGGGLQGGGGGGDTFTSGSGNAPAVSGSAKGLCASTTSPAPSPAVEIEMPLALQGAGKGGPSSLSDTIPDALSKVRSKARAKSHGWSWFFTHLRALLLKRIQFVSRDRRALCCQLILPILLIAMGLGLINIASLTTRKDYVLSVSDFNGGRDPTLAPRFNFKATGAGAGVASSSIASLLASGGAPFNPPTAYALEAAAVSLSQAEVTARMPSTSLPSAFTPLTGLSSPYYEYQQMSGLLLNSRSSFASSMYGAFVFTQANTSMPSQDPVLVPPTVGSLSVGIFANTTGSHAAPVYLNALDSAILASTSSAKKTITTHNWPLPQTATQAQLFSQVLTFAASLIIIIAFAFVASNTALYIVREREVSAKHQQLISGVSVTAYWTSNFIFDYATFLIPAAVAIILCKVFNISAFVNTDSQQLAALILNFLLFGMASTTSTYIICFIFKSPTSAQGTVLFVNIFAIILIAASQFLSQLQSTCKAELSLRFVFALLPSYNFGFNLVTLSFLTNLPLIQATCSGGNLRGLTAYQALDLPATGSLLIFLFCEFLAYSAIIIAIEFVQSRPSLLQSLFPDPKLPTLAHEEDPDVAAEEQRMLGQFTQGGTMTDAIAIKDVRKVYKGGKVAVHKLSFGVMSGEIFGFLGINGAGKTTTLQILSGDVIPTSGTARMAGYDIMTEQPEVRRLLGYCPQFDSLMELLTVKEHLELYARIKGVPEASVAGVVAKKISEMDLKSFANKTAGSLSGGNKRKLCVAISLIGDPPLVFLDEPSTGMDPQAKRFMWSVVNRVASEQKLCSIILTTHSMEEVEALCSRIGIMVGGRLRCLGSAQHLKNTHGRSYTVEVRVGPRCTAPEFVGATEEAMVRLGGVGESLTREDINRVAKVLGDESALEEIAEAGQGWSVANALQKNGRVPRHDFAAWWTGEQAQRRIIRHFMGAPGGKEAVFPGSTLAERQGTLIRLSVPQSHESLAQMFSKIEAAKTSLGLSFDASLGQVSLEAIFNRFASQQQEERGVARGFVQ